MKIIHPDIYDSSLSLNKTVEKLSDPKVTVDEDMLINLVAKYFYCYFLPDLVDTKLSLKDIEKFFEWGQIFCVASRKDKQIIWFKWDLDEVFFSLRFANNSYGLTMLGDIAPTVSILQDIILRKIDPNVFDGHYQWLDLWTGSGILLLAQYIQAVRNGFSSIHNVGVEYNGSAIPDLSKIADKLGFGKIVQWDTTQASLYQTLNLDRVSFFSNENIPTSGVPMTGKADPFHQNNIVLYGKFSHILDENTQTFPSAIGMHFAIDDFKQDIIWHHSNKFHSEFLSNLEQQLKWTDGFSYSDNWTIFHQLMVNGIALEKKLVPVHQVWYNLIDSQKVFKVPLRRHRWSDRAVRLSEKYGPDGD